MSTNRTMTVEYLALRFAQANDEWRRLQRLRASFVCDHEAGKNDPPDVLSSGGDPCWKWCPGETDTYENGQSFQSSESGYTVDEGDWCPSCVERGKVNTAVREAGKSRNSRLGALLRGARKVLR